jgi:hypothetical protein
LIALNRPGQGLIPPVPRPPGLPPGNQLVSRHHRLEPIMRREVAW